MATSSITKEFFVKDDTAFEKLKKELDTEPTLRKQVSGRIKNVQVKAFAKSAYVI